MTTYKEALTLALEALWWANEEINGWMDDAQGLDPVDHPEIMSAITAIKEALAQPDRISDLKQKTKDHSVDCLCADCSTLDEMEEALAQEQEPAKWMYPDALCDRSCLYVCTKGFTQFPECATTPPQRKPLTDEQKKKIELEWNGSVLQLINTVEAAHGIKE